MEIPVKPEPSAGTRLAAAVAEQMGKDAKPGQPNPFSMENDSVRWSSWEAGKARRS